MDQVAARRAAPARAAAAARRAPTRRGCVASHRHDDGLDAEVLAGRLAVDERGEAQRRAPRRAARGISSRAATSMPPVSPGHEEDEVEADVDHAPRRPQHPLEAVAERAPVVLALGQRRARRRPSAPRSAGSPSSRSAASANASGSSATSRWRPGSTCARPSQPSEVETSAPARGHRLDDLHADPGAGEDRDDDGVRLRRRTAPSTGTKPCTAMPSRPSSARTAVGRVLADDVEARVGQRAPDARPDLVGEPADPLVVRRVAHRAGEQQPRRARRGLGRRAAARRVSTPVGISSTRVGAERAHLVGLERRDRHGGVEARQHAQDVAAVARRLGAQRAARARPGRAGRATGTSAR